MEKKLKNPIKTTFRKAVFIGPCGILPVPVTGKEIQVEGSPYHFGIERGQNRVTNLETGFSVGTLETFAKENFDHINKVVAETLEYFGDIREYPEVGKQFESWYDHWNIEFKKYFPFDLPHDIHGFAPYKMEDIIWSKFDGIRAVESISDAIARIWGDDANKLVDEILYNPPFYHWFYKEGK